MNLENTTKYYQPTIEEFHVGFECEIETSWGYNTGKWPEILKEDTLTGFEVQSKGALESTKPYGFRVKYLDQEDIESLGFRLLKDFSVDQEYQSEIKDGVWYELNVDDKEEIPYLITIEEWMDNSNGRSDCRTLFKGNIKNKSELKTLFKQLGI